MFVYLCLVLVTPAVLGMDVNPEMLYEFKSVFHEAIHQHLQAEYYLLMPMLAKQNETWEMCKEAVFTHKSSCRACVQSNCRTEVSDLVGEHWENLGNMLEAPGENRADWLGWERIGNTLFDEETGMNNQYNMMPPGTGMNNNPNMYGGMEEKRLFSFLRPQNWSNFFGQGGILSNVWNGFSNTLSNVGSSLVDTVSGLGSSIGNTISGWFGRRRRSAGMHMSARSILLLKGQHRRQMERFNEESNECLEQCNECSPYFEGDFNGVLSAVCGEDFVTDEANMAAMMMQVQELYRVNLRVERGTPTILKKIEYNPDDFRLSSLSFGEVYVTAMTPSGPMRYRSEYRFRPQSPQVSAIEMVEELIEMWGL